mgnify:CR=1 FL=1
MMTAAPFARPDRYQNRQEVLAFLQNHLSPGPWTLTPPPAGRGHETYLAQSDGQTYFIKLGARTAHYEALAALNLTPAVVATGRLTDGTTILVQSYAPGRSPTWQDFRRYLKDIALVVQKVHHSPAIKQVLAAAPSPAYRDAALAALARLQRKWAAYRPQVTAVAPNVDAALAQIEREIQAITGGGLAACHNDICNANWLITPDEKIFLVDLDAMSLDDPAHDLGALLWWYYPPELRPSFLAVAGYDYDDLFKRRMRLRMALHCLDILLPRAQSFDQFDARAFPDWLTDFWAVVAGRENPHGYDDD